MAEKKEKKTSIGGATFWPRLNPRPKYPGWGEWFKEVVVYYTRAPIMMAVIAKLVFPRYMSIVKSLKSRGWNDASVFAILAMTVHSGLYFGVNSFFYFVEKYGFLEKYRMEKARKRSQLASPELFRNTLKEAVINQFVVGPFAAYAGYSMLQKMGSPGMVAKLPGFVQMVKMFVLAHFVNDVGFYWIHRLVHSKPLYAMIHKQHHSYKATIGFAAEYASPTEQVLANQGPTLLGMGMQGCHPLLLFVWLAYRLEETYEAHSGYCFKDTVLGKLGMFHGHNSIFHAHHHSHNTGNFGAWHLDYLFGTMDTFVAQGGYEGYLTNKEAEKNE